MAARRRGRRRRPVSISRSRAGPLAGVWHSSRCRADKRGAFALFAALAAVSAGFVSADWKSARVAAPVLDRVRVTTVIGFIEQMDYRRQGARFVMRPASAEGLSPEQMPRRIRLTDRYRPPAEAVAFVKLKARLLPPARAALPGGYDFACDAYFAELGAVGNMRRDYAESSGRSLRDAHGALLARTVPGRVRHARSGARLRIRRNAAILVRRTYASPIGLIDFTLYGLILHFADELQKIFYQKYAARRCTSLTAVKRAPTFDLQPHFAILDGFHE